MEWISAYDERKPDKVFLVHGDDEAMETLSQLIREKTGLSVDCPYSGSIFDLMSGKWIAVAEPKKIVKSDLIPGMHGRRRASDSAYERLMSAYNKLLAAVQANYGGANKDLAKFTDQILNLYDKWIR
jgi:metallo-beta-lactamase family protein